MTFTKDQEKRFKEFLEEIEAIQDLCGDWTTKEHCDYIKAWIDRTDKYNGYVISGAVRPHRPHNP